MRSWNRIFAFLLFAVALAGCSSSDSSPSAPTQACNQVLDETCASFARCGLGSKSDCMSQAGAALDCSRAVGTSANLQACLDALPKVDCASFPPLPTVCNGVILAKSASPTTSSPEVETLVPSGAARAIVAPVDDRRAP